MIIDLVYTINCFSYILSFNGQYRVINSNKNGFTYNSTARKKSRGVEYIIRSAGEEVHVQNEVINSNNSMSQSEDTRENNFSHVFY